MIRFADDCFGRFPGNSKEAIFVQVMGSPAGKMDLYPIIRLGEFPGIAPL